jgi:regulator of replication initiation timing
MAGLVKLAYLVKGTEMTEAQLAQLHHELSRIERDITEATNMALELRKENVRLRSHVEHLRDVLIGALGDDERWFNEACTWLEQNDAEFSGHFND